MNAYAIAIAVSLLVYVVVGNYAGRRIRGLDDYLVAGRRAPTLLIIGTLVASTVSTGSFLGDTGFIYNGYATSQIFGFVPLAVIGFIVGGLFFGRYLRRSGALTLAQYFGERFASSRVRRVSAITVLVGVGAYLLAVNQGVALVIAEVADISYTQALIAVWLGYSAFTIYGGSRGVVLTDTLMFLFFTGVAFVGMHYIVAAPGGWFETMRGLAVFEPRPGIIGAGGYTGPGAVWPTSAELWTWSIILGTSWGIAYAISPWQSSRYLMARDEHVVMRSACIACCTLAMMWPALYYSGAAIALSNATIAAPEHPMIWAAQNLMPVVVGALLLAGIVAAGLSSASTFLSLIGFAISNDLVQSGGSDRDKLRFSRVAMLVAGVAILVIALAIPPNIFWITAFAGPMFAACWGPIAFASIWSRRVTEPGAFWGMLAGLGTLVLTKLLSISGLFSPPAWLDPILVGVLVSMITIVVVSSRTRISAAETEYRERLHRPPPELADADAARHTLLWPKLTIAFGILATTVMLLVYVRPVQVATGLVDERGGPWLVLNGELALAVGFGIVICSGGLVALFATRRFLAGEQDRPGSPDGRQQQP